MAASVRCTSPPRAPVTSESLETVLQSGGSCQENKIILVKIHQQRKRDPTPGQKKIRPKTKVSLRTSQETQRDSDSCQKWRDVEMICPIQTSFLTFLTLHLNYVAGYTDPLLFLFESRPTVTRLSLGCLILVRSLI